MINIKPIFAIIYSADFYPEGKPDKIQITLDAPKDTEAYAGEVVIVPIELYKKLELLQAQIDEMQRSNDRIDSMRYAFSAPKQG